MFLKATVGEISSSSKLSGGIDRSRRVSCAGFCHARNSEVDHTLNFFIVFPFLQRLESEVQLMEETCKQTQTDTTDVAAAKPARSCACSGCPLTQCAVLADTAFMRPVR